MADEIELSSQDPPLQLPAPNQVMSQHSIYHPLPAMHIRVLDILPVDHSTQNPDIALVTAEIRIIDLQNEPNFTALSYVWGTFSQPADYIICGDTQVSVSTNCQSALRHLRKKLGRFTIWVDAVCINQNDNREKEQQIPLMGEIYTLANQVYLWLGEGTIGSDRAMYYMENVNLTDYFQVLPDGKIKCRPFTTACWLYFQTWKKNIHLGHSHTVPRLIARVFRSSTQPHQGILTFKDFQELLWRPWITRVWTYQELLLATNPVVVCGDRHVNWENVERSMLLLPFTKLFSPEVHTWTNIIMSRDILQTTGHLAHSDTAPSVLEMYKTFLTQTFFVYGFINFSCFGLMIADTVALIIFLSRIHYAHYFHPVIPFLILAMIYLIYLWQNPWKYIRYRHMASTKDAIMAGLYTRTATEPQDMAYGMWAVLQRGGVVDLPAPDLSRPTGDLYRIFTTRFSQASSSMDFLLAASVRGSPDQPSWVPDWLLYRRSHWHGTPFKMQNTTVYGYSIYNTGAALAWRPLQPRAMPPLRISDEPLFSFDSTDSILTVTAGRVFGVHQTLYFQTTNVLFDEAESDIHLRNLEHILLAAAVRSFLGFGRRYDNQPVFPDNIGLTITRFFQPEWRAACNERETRRWFSFCKRRGNKDLQQTFTLLRRDTMLLNTHIKMCNFLSKPPICLFFTHEKGGSNQKVWGICSPKVREGDQIIRIAGLPQLLIVREYAEGVGKAVKLVSPVGLLVPRYSSNGRTYWPTFKEVLFEQHNIC